jgi:CheY-like chemotaxis protein
MKYASKLFENYKNYYAYGRLTLLKYTGIVGSIGYPLFYFIYIKVIHQPYENIPIRLIATIACFLMIWKDRWPEKLKPYYLVYSYWTLLYCLPFFHVFMTLKNHGGMVLIADSFMAVFFLVLIADWLNTIVMLLLGGGLASLLYIATTPNPSVPMDYVARLPTFILVLVGGNLFKFSEKQITDRLRLTTALAGSIAHEMRNPLGQIKYNLDCVEHNFSKHDASNLDQSVPAEKLSVLFEHLAQGQLAIRRGLQVISMTLDAVSEKAIDDASFGYLRAGYITQQAADEYNYDSESARRKVRVNIVNDFTFKGDETTYIFVLFNLIKNALYYCQQYPASTINIVIDSPMVTVTDTGPGIAKDIMPQMFEAFLTSGKAGGTGLGLAYCKRAMQAFGGAITCESIVGEYTKFTLHFPEVSQAEFNICQQAVMARAESVLNGKRILIVNDDALLRATTAQVLKELGTHIDQAENGQLALERLKDAQYDLILMGTDMPLLNGYEAAKKIRAGAVPSQQFIPIIAYSSESADIARAKERKAGMNGFVGMPYTQLELAEALMHALAHVALPHGIDAVVAALAGKAVLLAEDNDLNRMIVSSRLEQWGMRVIEAADGQEVLTQLEAHPGIHVILMDLSMPGMNGLEATLAIRSQESSYRHIPIIALTGNSDDASVDAAYAAGMNDFIIKPVDASTLCAKLYREVGKAATVAPDSQIQALPSLTQASHVPLLNMVRLEEFRQLDMLDCLPVYLGKMELLLDRLSNSAATGNMIEIRHALHALLGMSGDAGTFALHQLIRHYYLDIKDGRLPGQGDWLERIKQLSVQSALALRTHFIISGSAS